MLGLHLLGRRAGKGALGVNQLFRAKRRTALFALVAIGIGVAALGAGAGNVAVGQEHLGFLVVVLLRFLGDELVVVVQLAEELRGILFVHLGRGAGIDVEVDAQAREGVLHHFMVLVHYVLRCNAGLARLDGDGHAVLVGSADKHHILAPHAQVTHKDVSGNVGASQMADMDGTVGIGKCAGHQGSLKTHFFSLPSLILMVFLISLIRLRLERISSCSSGPAPARRVFSAS